MHSDQLFSEDILDALRDVVRALGGPKEVGKGMRPEMSADAAGHWVKDCLNPDRRERFDPMQVMWLIREGRRIGCHSIINYICDEASYVRPSPLDPVDEAGALMRAFIESTKEQKRIAERLERIQGIRAVA